MKRIFLIVLDSFGIGEMPDADKFGDKGSNTFAAVQKSKNLKIPNMTRLGLFNIDGVLSDENNQLKQDKPTASYARLAEVSMGKDTTIGHWEIAGVISKDPLPTYPSGFPKEIIDEFEEKTGRKVICNLPYSGTEVINKYGKDHMETGALIVYTSADSVFQIAAHEEIVPLDDLYKYCKIAREMLKGKHGVGRVIARPFIGSYKNFTRTSNRHDFSLEPPKKTMLNYLLENGNDVLAVGKIKDIFAGNGIGKYVYTSGNADGINKTIEFMKEPFNGLCFVNLVDFDMLYGHRNDSDGYAAALTYFDDKLPEILQNLKDDDMLMITADHGCDPSTESTDHSREYVPLLITGKNIKPVNLGTRNSFADISKTILDIFSIENNLDGISFWDNIKK